MAKCSSSAMIHGGRRRNLNEFCGAYGHNLTFAEMKWLADWCLVRGVNLLVPHAFYYSVRGPRRDERPPDVGPNSPWWADFKRFADYCRWLCWLNTDSRHVCEIAILCESNQLPWRTAKILQQNQLDFHYLERGATGAGNYKLVISEDLSDTELLAAVARTVPADLQVSPPQPDLRYRHVVKDGTDYYLLFNEGSQTISFRWLVAVQGTTALLDPSRQQQTPVTSAEPLTLPPHELRVLQID